MPTPSDSLQTSVEGRVLQHALEVRLFGSAEPVQLGRFSVLGSLGRGGMGSVYAAYDPDLDRRVAVKVLHSLGGSRQPPERLIREAKALARLTHPFVVTVHEVGVHDGHVFIAMEYAPGGTLTEWAKTLQGDPGRFDAIVARMRECIEGLQAAHDAGIVHRDFKPANVLIGADGRAKVADFGLAQVHSDPDPTEEHDLQHAPSGSDSDRLDPEPSGENSQLTTDRASPSAAIAGTPAYMAPEHFDGETSPRSDQFSVCATFFEVLYGEPAFEGKTITALVARINEGPSQPRDRGVPDWMFALLARGLSADPKDRFDSMRALDDVLDRALRPRRRAGVVFGVVGLASAAVAIAWPRPEATIGAAPSGSPCTDGREILAPAWGAERQEGVKAAFEATAQPSWPGIWERVESRLGRWSDGWSSAYRVSCEATRVHGTQTEETLVLRTLCMERQRDHILRLTDAYLAASPESIYEASKTSLQLPRVADCADRTALRFADGALDLASPELRKFFGLYDEGIALSHQSKHGEAEPYLREAADLAAQAGAPSLAAKAYRGLEAALSSAGKNEEAEVAGRSSLHYAELAGDGAGIVRGWSRLAWLAHLDDRESDEAFYFQRATDNADGFNVRDEVRADIVATAARRARGSGKPAEAAQLYLQSAVMLEQLGIEPLSASVHRQAATGPLLLAGKGEEARENAKQAIASAEALFGRTHPATLAAKSEFASYLATMGDIEAALELTTFVVANLPPPDGMRAQLRHGMTAFHANVLLRNDRADEALEILKTTLTEASEFAGEGSSSALEVRINYASVLYEQKRLDEALVQYELLAKLGTPDAGILPNNRGGMFMNYASTLAELGRFDEAVVQLDKAVEILSEVSAPMSASRFQTMYFAGKVFARAGQPERARTLFTKGLAIAETTKVNPRMLSRLKEQLAALD